MMQQQPLIPVSGTRRVHTSEVYDVYGGRPRGGSTPAALKPGEHGWLGNPFSVRDFGQDAIPPHEQYFDKRLETEPAFRLAVKVLHGKAIACPGCRKGRCHLDHVVKRVRELNGET